MCNTFLYTNRKESVVHMQIEHIRKKYGKHIVLTDISLKSEKGRCIGILGGNGSGKSTLLSILAGTARCDGGVFSYNGANLLEDGEMHSQIVGYVPQGTPLFEELSALDNLRLWYDRSEIKKELRDGVLKMLGIDEFLKTTVRKMSGGMKKRLAIGCAVAHKPKVLLLDEPSAALDIICKESIANYIKEFKNAGGIVILATHDTGEIPLCDELYILKNGVLTPYTYDGDIRNLAERL